MEDILYIIEDIISIDIFPYLIVVFVIFALVNIIVKIIY